MKYSQSELLLEKIRQANNILINCHRGPDSDCVGSALSLSFVLKQMGKDVAVICPDDLSPELQFLPFTKTIKKVSFFDFDFSQYDLFISVDTSHWDNMAESPDFSHPSIETFVIDNHKSNKGFGTNNLLDFETSSVSEMLYNIYQDWKVEITQEVATLLYAGILGDTGLFQYEIYPHTFRIAGELTQKGADRDAIILQLFNSRPLALIKLWGELLVRMQQNNFGFVWSALDYSTVQTYGLVPGVVGSAATLFARIIKDTNFGIIIVETKPQIVNVSFRARTDFDVSQIAVELGGGGHKAAAGATLEQITFKNAVEKIITVAQKYASRQ